MLVGCRPALLLRLRQKAAGRAVMSPEWAPQTPSVDEIQTLVVAAGIAAREMAQLLGLLKVSGGICEYTYRDAGDTR